MGAADQANTGFEPDHAVNARRASDRAIGLGPDCGPCETGCDRCAAARRRAAQEDNCIGKLLGVDLPDTVVDALVHLYLVLL